MCSMTVVLPAIPAKEERIARAWLSWFRLTSAITEVRRNQDSQARAILSSFAGIAGNTTVIEHIRVYEDSVPTRGEELTEEEERTNKELIKRLRELRKGL